jgi:hypothetical protein
MEVLCDLFQSGVYERVLTAFTCGNRVAGDIAIFDLCIGVLLC